MIMTIAQMATGHNASDAALIMQLSNQSGMSAGASANAASEANSLSNSMNQDLMDWVASLRPARYVHDILEFVIGYAILADLNFFFAGISTDEA